MPDELNLRSTEVQPGEGWYAVARRLGGSQADQAVKDRNANYLAAANGSKDISGPLYPHQIVWYNPDRLEVDDPAPPPPPPVGDRFQVTSDGLIVDPTGEPFLPVGVNCPIKIAEYSYIHEHGQNLGSINSVWQNPTRFPSHVAEAQAWGFNTIRVSLILNNRDPNGPTPNSAVQMLDAIRHGLNELLAGGFVILLGAWDRLGSSPSTVIPGSAADDDCRAFWRSLIVEYGDNPRVWINPYNEPYNDEIPQALTNWLGLHRSYVEFLRAEGYTGPIACDLPRYGQSINVLASGALDQFASEDDNLIFGWHAYGYADPAAEQTAAKHTQYATQARARGHCVLIGEYGVHNPPSTAGWARWETLAADWVNANAADLGMGFLYWHALSHGPHHIRLDGRPFWHSTDGSGLTTSGRGFWDALTPWRNQP